jgi:uncharacterized protein YcbK (DUF882 family)
LVFDLRGTCDGRERLTQFNKGWHVTVKVAISNPGRSIRAGYRCSIAALLLFFGCGTLQTAVADGETRTISFHHIHTKEDLTVTYKVNGQYDEEALKKINLALRDWREAEPIKMDPHLIDLLWEVHHETGSREPIWVVCGYRSPKTNSMLRGRSRGVAKASQHMLGKAVDFYIPGVAIEDLRAAGLRAQRGGVGYYPTSGSPFVHLDTGSVRHWPRMPEAQVAKILAKGQLASAHASDGRSTKRVTVAQASSTPSFLSKLFGGGEDPEGDAEAAAATSAKPAKTASAASKTESKAESKAAPKIARAAMAARASAKPAAVAANVPMPPAKPTRVGTFQVASAKSVPVKPASYEIASAESTPVKLASYQVASAGSSPVKSYQVADATSAPVRPAQAASLVAHNAAPSANAVINDRGYWQGLPSAEPVDAARTTVTRSKPATRRSAAVANAAPWPLTDRGGDRTPSVGALAYASQPASLASRANSLGDGHANSAPVASHGMATAAVGPVDDAPAVPAQRKGPDVVQVGDRFNDPWMRAMMLSPSAQSFLRTTLYGLQDFRTLGEMFAKPSSVVIVKFTADPTNGLSTTKFSGGAVGFTPTLSFVPRTASLR